MAAVETRLLVLAAVKVFAPINGSQVREELVGWGAGRWGRLKSGSVYSTLTSLAKQELLIAHKVADGARTVTVYTLSPAGQKELDRIFERIIAVPDPATPLNFFMGAALSSLLTRDRFLQLLRIRQDSEQRFTAALDRNPGLQRPTNVEYSISLWQGVAEVGREWVARTIEVVEQGGLTFEGETGTEFAPIHPDLPVIRARYQRLIVSQAGTPR